jgi:hypothetical protein
MEATSNEATSNEVTSNGEYSKQWMIENIPEENILDDSLIEIKCLFFGALSKHGYEFSKLIWLSRWIGNIQNYHYQNSDIKEIKRLDFLKNIWLKPYFHPFATTDEAYHIVDKDKTLYVVGLSSTMPGMIRITYFLDGIKHHRIHLETYKFRDIEEKIDYDVVRLEHAIQKFIQTYTSSIHSNNIISIVVNADYK